MVFLRVKPRVVAAAGDALTLGDVADVWADARYRLSETRVAMPVKAGIWPIEALSLILQIQDGLPGEVVNVLGDGRGLLHRRSLIGRKPRGNAPGRALLAASVLAVIAATVLMGVPGALIFGVGSLLGAAQAARRKNRVPARRPAVKRENGKAQREARMPTGGR